MSIHKCLRPLQRTKKYLGVLSTKLVFEVLEAVFELAVRRRRRGPIRPAIRQRFELSLEVIVCLFELRRRRV